MKIKLLASKLKLHDALKKKYTGSKKHRGEGVSCGDLNIVFVLKF